MSKVKQRSKRKLSKAAVALGAAGVSFAMVGGQRFLRECISSCAENECTRTTCEVLVCSNALALIGYR